MNISKLSNEKLERLSTFLEEIYWIGVGEIMKKGRIGKATALAQY